MTMTDLRPDTLRLDGRLQPADPPRRLRALRMPVMLAPLAMLQLMFGVMALAGVYVQFGWGITLITGGVVGAVLSALREAGKI